MDALISVSAYPSLNLSRPTARTPPCSWFDRGRTAKRTVSPRDGWQLSEGRRFRFTSDLFGVNGLRLLDGLVAGKSKADLLASLSHHFRRHLESLCDALSTDLNSEGRFLLRDQLWAFHAANARRAHYDRRLEDGLVEFRDRIHPLMTIPGIDRASPGAIIVELGPDIGVFASRRHRAAWAGLCPGNNQSAGKRRHGRTRRGNLTLREVLIECAHAAARTHHCSQIIHGTC